MCHAPISDARPLIPPHCHLLPLSFARSANHAVRGPSRHLRAQAPVPPHRRARRSARTQPPSSALSTIVRPACLSNTPCLSASLATSNVYSCLTV